MNYEEACKYIENAAKLGSRPGLERIKALCDELGNPEEELRFIHVAGTNGKGSTACFIASALFEAGLRVGMYYSPAISGIRDHFRINGELISADDYADTITRVTAANDRLIDETNDGATQFELETAAAFTYFGNNHCDVVILECGMGGREDATNIVCNKICCVLTSISYDHMQYLGNTLGEITKNKAGIITCDCPVVALSGYSESTEAIKEKCRETGSRLELVLPEHISFRYDPAIGGIVDYEEFRNVKTGLFGTFQAENAALAMRTLTVLSKLNVFSGYMIDENTIRRGLKVAKWPCRFECISRDPLIFADGAHNADAALKLRDTVDMCLKGYRIILIMGVFADKEYEKVTKTLAAKADMILTVETPDNPRALPAEELAKCAIRYCDNVHACDSIEDAYEGAVCAAADKDKTAIVACGSLSYLEEFRRIADKHNG